jgi:hypothetical protein
VRHRFAFAPFFVALASSLPLALVLSCSAAGVEHGKSNCVPDDSNTSLDEEEEDISEDDEYADAEDDGFIKIW